MGKMFFNILATFAEFEADLIRLRTREGMAIARAKRKPRGKQPKLSDRQQRELRRMHDTGDYRLAIGRAVLGLRPTVYRTLGRQGPPHSAEEIPPFIAEGHSLLDTNGLRPAMLRACKRGTFAALAGRRRRNCGGGRSC